MKITNIECYVLKGARGTVKGFHSSTGVRNTILVKTFTDNDIYGIGEAFCVGPDSATLHWVKYFEEQLIGQDPRRIEYLWARMYQGARIPPGSSGMAALSAIEMTLWDILGKSVNSPVYELLGGQFRDRVRGYDGAGGDTPEQLCEAIQKAIERGLTAIKTSPLPSNFRSLLWNDALAAVEERMKVVREKFGYSFDIALDTHAAIFEPSKTLEIEETVRQYKPLFMEDPIRMENYQAMADLRKKFHVPLATGECTFTKWQTGQLISLKAVDIFNPDICLVGGMLELKKIAANAEGNDLSIAPHNPMGPVATMANIHFAFSTPNFVILEHRGPTDIEKNIVINTPETKEGYFSLPQGPGWGIDLNMEYLKDYISSDYWHREEYFLEDGTPAHI